MIRRNKLIRLLESPFCLVFILEIVAIFLIRPFGNFPVNDDWQYAWVAKTFAESGHFRVTVPVAPSLVVQSILAYPLIRLFGFSHLLLRALTWIVSLGLLWVLDRILKVLAKANVEVRLVSLLLVAFNPIYLQLSLSYMSEIYGFTLVLFGIWFYYLPIRSGKVLGALVSAMSFWARQFSAVLFVGHLVSSVIQKDLRLSCRRLFPGLLFAVVVFAYFPWVHWSGNFRPQFANPMRALFSPALDRLWAGGVFSLIYLTFSLAPLIWATGSSAKTTKAMQIRRALFALFLFPPLMMAATKYSWPTRTMQWLRPIFPFYGNLFTYQEFGPTTLTNSYVLGVPVTPVWARILWGAVEIALVLLSFRWVRVFFEIFRSKSKFVQGCFWSALFTFLVVQLAYRGEIFDRYGIGILLTAVCGWVGIKSEESWSSSRSRIALIAASGMAMVSVVGTHDYFRWLEARERLVARASSLHHLNLDQLDAGYEPNGWRAYSGQRVETDSCSHTQWFCTDRPNRLAMAPNPEPENFNVIDQEEVGSWVSRRAPILLLSRKSGAVTAP